MSSDRPTPEATPREASLAVELRGIWKRFPGVIANAGADLRVRAGTVHAVLGENGAGKSTLMNVLAGVYHPDEGEVIVDGLPRRFVSPRDALEAGIAMVHQEFRLVPSFTVAENVVLGAAPALLDRDAIAEQVAELARRYRLRVEPDVGVWQLSIGERQRVEILKALWRDARILILDEPTAVLTPQEADELGHVLRSLVADGRTVLFITHKLREVETFADEVTVLREGRTVAGPLPIRTVDREELARLMVGETAPTRRPPAPTVAADRPALEVEGLVVASSRGDDAVRGVDLVVHHGEIVGIAGVAGNGQRELAEAIAGLRPARGTVRIDGRDVSRATPRARYRAGLAFVPEDRLGMGLAPRMTVTDNAILRAYDRLHRGPVMSTTRAEGFARDLVGRFGVRAGRLDVDVATLSGGNLQRLLLGRELHARPAVVVAAQPTRGLDVAGVAAIQHLLLEQRAEGAGVLLISEDLDELLELSDRLYVMYEGRIVAEFDPGLVDRRTVGLAMAGVADGEGTAGAPGA